MIINNHKQCPFFKKECIGVECALSIQKSGYAPFEKICFCGLIQPSKNSKFTVTHVITGDEDE